MIYLASKSPRRQELLQQIDVDFEVVSTDIDETPHTAEKPGEYVKRMAIEKALAAYKDSMEYPLLAADTSVICEGRILGKPENKEDFLGMMELLSDNTHQVITCVAVTTGSNINNVKTRLSVSEVTFSAIPREWAQKYWATSEPTDKAGGYAIQGKAAVFIKNINGSYSGIMGLPLYETVDLLEEFTHYSF